MLNKIVISAFIILFFSGCASDQKTEATADKFTKTCSDAERNGNLEVAENTCYQALVNADLGNLGDDLKSEKLYNLARIKRRLSKYHEAESLLNQSLEIEEAKSKDVNEEIGRRLIEMSVNLAALHKWDDGAKSLKRVIPIAEKYTGSERKFLILVLYTYGTQLNKDNKTSMGNYFLKQAKKLS